MAHQPYSERMALNSPKGRAGRPVTNAETARIAERRAEVAGMLLEHRTYREMAQRLDCSAATITEDVTVVRAEWHERATDDYGAWLAEEMAKLHSLERVMLPQALAGQTRAVHAVLGVMTRRAKLLGLDRPERMQVTTPPEEPSRTLAELFGIFDGDERALARVVCAQLGRGNGDGN
jgi:hypothetical protein